MYYGAQRGRFPLVCAFLCSLRFFCSFSSGYDAQTFSFSQMLKQNFRNEVCRTRVPGRSLSGPLLKLCRDNTLLFLHASQGFHRGLKICRLIFENNRWNCTTHSSGDYQLFGTVMARGSKEAAIMFAMISAGMVRKITSEIQKGKREQYSAQHDGCSHFRRPRNVHEYINPRDCDADITIGDTFARKLMEYWIDAQKGSKEESLMNEHNAAVGRLAVRGHMQTICRCHGLSGACNFQSCYRILEPLKSSALWLKKQYQKAVEVTTAQRWKRDGTRSLVTIGDPPDIPPKTQLIYLLKSPNYCQNDRKTGSLGTSGRSCNATADPDSEGSCKNLCCGRGYETHENKKEDFCNCKFAWCCKVTCDACTVRVTSYRCK